MADNIWGGMGGTKYWSTPGDWSLNHVPQAGEDVIFNGVGSAHCNIDVSTAALLSISVTSAESITITQASGSTVTCTGLFSADGGTWDANGQTLDVGLFSVGANIIGFTSGAATITVSGDCSIADVGSIATFSGSTLTIDGSGNLYNPRTTNGFDALAFSGSITTTFTSDSQVNGMFTTGTGTINGGGFTINLMNGVTNEGPTWGTAGVLCFCSTSGTHSISGDDYSPWSIECRNDTATYNQTGSVTAAGFIGTGDNDWNMSGHNLTLTGNLQVGGTNPALDGFVVSVGAGTLEVSGNVALQGADALQNQINGGSGTVKVGGSWTVDTGDTVDPDFIPGTSTVIFDGGGTQTVTSGGVDFGDVDIACSGTVDMADAFACRDLTMTAGSFDDGGNTCTISGAVDINTAGSYAFSGTWTQTGDANFIVQNNGTPSIASWKVVLQGTGTFTIAKPGYSFTDLTCAASGKVTTVTGATLNYTGTLTLGTGTITLNTILAWSGTGAESTPIATAGATFNGSGTLNIVARHAGLISIAIPALTITGTVNVFMSKALGDGVCTYNLGALSVPYLKTFNAMNLATAGVVVATGGNAVTATVDWSFGSSVADGPFTLNMGASTVSVLAVNTSIYNGTGATTLNMGTSAWTVTGDWITQTNHTISVSAWSVDFGGSGTQNITSAGESFATVVVTGTPTVELQDAFTCTDFTLTTGTFDTNSVGDFGMTVTSFEMNGGTFNANGSAIVCSGSCERLGGTLNGASATWDLTGSGNLQNNNLTTPFGLVKCAAVGEVTTLTNTCVAKKWEFGTGVLTASGSYEFSVYQPAAGKIITNAGVTIDASGGTNPNYHHWYGAGGQGFTYDPVDFGSGNIAIDPGTNTYFDLLGHWTTAGSFTYSGASNGSNFDFNGYNLTCGAIIMSGSGSNTSTIYCGEGVVDCTSFATAAVAGVATLNLETCTFECSGDFTIGHANHVIVKGTSTIELDGSGAQAIDFLGEQVHHLDVTNIGGTVSFTTALDVQGTFKPGNGASTVTIRFPTSGTTHWNAIDTSAASGTGTIDLNSIGEAASWALTIGSNQTVTSVDVMYSNLTGFTINAGAATNVDGGNNSANWEFGAPPTDVFAGDHNVARGIARGVMVGVG